MEVVLAVHANDALGVPVPDRFCVTLFRLLVTVILPEAGPGDPDAGANVMLNVWL